MWKCRNLANTTTFPSRGGFVTPQAWKKEQRSGKYNHHDLSSRLLTQYHVEPQSIDQLHPNSQAGGKG